MKSGTTWLGSVVMGGINLRLLTTCSAMNEEVSLAEKRHKLKWTTDPRNTLWSKGNQYTCSFP